MPVRAPAPAPHDDESDSDAEALARDAQAMVSDDDADRVQAMQFLSRTKLPDVSAAGAQGRAKERIRDEKRRQRQWFDTQRQAIARDDSDGESTDMEGASESEEEEAEEEEDDDDDLDDDDVDEDDEDDEALEAQYLHQAARRERRAQADREARAQRPLPIRTEAGIQEQGSDTEPSGSRAVFSDEAADSDEEAATHAAPTYHASSAAHSARFGMQAPYTLVSGALSESPAVRTAALQSAREQIAHLSSNIVGDPELGTSWLQRLLVFAQPTCSPPPGETGRRVRVHAYIRQLALLSLLAVFVDIIPGYRIRALSEQEQKERVSQDVARRREWEQGLVNMYRDFLECCEAEIRKSASPLAPIALKCFCTLLVRAPHFNYRKNLLASVIAIMSRPVWNASSEQCSQALIQLLRSDADGEIGLELVMLLNRMIRERKLAVHANVLDVLVHLRLREELRRSVRSGPMGRQSSMPTAAENRRADPKQVRKGLAMHRSKKQVKRDRALREIEAEMREADATLDVEERERHQSETLKLVFALYFRLLKSEVPIALYASALEGIVQFAHHVSADFFRDLVEVLRTRLHSALASLADDHDHDGDPIRLGLLCIVAALELQAGQGGALELDMAQFYVALYRLLWPLAMSTNIEEGTTAKPGTVAGLRQWSTAALFFHALETGLIKAPRHTLQVSLDRTAAMVRRVLGAAMHWPTTSALKALQCAHAILSRATTMDSRFDALLDNRDAIHDGQFDPYTDQPDSARVLASGEPCWELILLSRSHANAQVRETATALLQWTRT